MEQAFPRINILGKPLLNALGVDIQFVIAADTESHDETVCTSSLFHSIGQEGLWIMYARTCNSPMCT